jgi:uncharacterized membrane protein YdfJ with MMPL/SSD domain
MSRDFPFAMVSTSYMVLSRSKPRTPSSRAFRKKSKAAIQKAAQNGKVLKVETVTKGSAVSYEAVVSKNGKKSEVAVEADGTIKK